MEKRKNTRSLKRRITKMVAALNFCSLLIMLLTLLIALAFVFNIFSRVISENAANQLNFQLSDELSRDKSAPVVPGNERLVVPSNNDSNEMYKRIGYSYIFFKNNKYKFNIGKSADYNVSMPNKMPDLTIQYKIYKNNKLVYDSLSSSENNFKGLPKHLNSFTELINKTTSVNVMNSTNNESYKIQVKLNPNVILFGYIGLITVCMLIFLITLFISKVATSMLTSVIIKPLCDLDKKLNEIANGNIEAAMQKEIVFTKPIDEVEKLANYTNIIMSKMQEYVCSLASQNSELEAQNITLHENGAALSLINGILDNNNVKLKNIFNNVEQGFLTFKKDLLIHKEYSLECEKLLGTSIGGEKLSSLLYGDNINMGNFMDELLIKIFNSDASERELYFTLLPEELSVSEKEIFISYKIVKDENNEDIIMVIINDITEKRIIERRMDEESKTLKMVVKTIINRDEFRELVKQYNEFVIQDFKAVTQERYEEILRQIHTFKGNFSQFEMINLVDRLNELENKLYEKQELFYIDNLNNNELKSWLMEDLSIIESYTGKDFINEGDFCYIKKEKLFDIEKKVRETLSLNECRVILPLIKSLRYTSVKDSLKTYPDYVMKLSERLEKSIYPLNIIGDDVLIDTAYYHDVIKSLVHIFRNSVDHGIETEDERVEQGKEQIGSISCKILDLANSFQIIISDDGKGIDVQALELKLIKEGLYTKEELGKMENEEKYELIFQQGITTKEEANIVSGRGVGMSAVKESVMAINGTIEVESEEGKGTIFTLTFNKLENGEEEIASVEDFMKEMVVTARNVIFSQTGINFESQAIEVKNVITLNKLTALINLKGTFNSILMVSVNESMAKKLVKGFMLQDIEENDIINYIEGVLGEISNTILGGTFGKFENTNNIFHIGMPAVLSNSEAYIKYTQSPILTCKLIHEEDEFSINMLLVEGNISLSELEEGI